MYNFLSAPNLAVNIKTEEASFKLHGGKLTVDGSFMTEAHVVARVGGSKQKWANFSFWASELTDENWSWRMIDGTCGGHYTKLGPGGVKNCEELNIKVEIPRDPPPTHRKLGTAHRVWNRSTTRAPPSRLVTGPSPCVVTLSTTASPVPFLSDSQDVSETTDGCHESSQHSPATHSYMPSPAKSRCSPDALAAAPAGPSHRLDIDFKACGAPRPALP